MLFPLFLSAQRLDTFGYSAIYKYYPILSIWFGICIFNLSEIAAKKDVQDHNVKLDGVLEWLCCNGLTVKQEKCKLRVNSVTYLGHVIDANGVRPREKLVNNIVNTIIPVCKEDLKSFLGVIEFYARFVKPLC